MGVVWRGKTSAFEMCFPRQKEKTYGKTPYVKKGTYCQGFAPNPTAFFRRKLGNPLSFSKESGQRKLTILVCSFFMVCTNNIVYCRGDHWSSVGVLDVPPKTISFVQTKTAGASPRPTIYQYHLPKPILQVFFAYFLSKKKVGRKRK